MSRSLATDARVLGRTLQRLQEATSTDGEACLMLTRMLQADVCRARLYLWGWRSQWTPHGQSVVDECWAEMGLEVRP